jgi:ABC-2 type transport system permease protein
MMGSRYTRTLRLFWGASIAAEMEYRLNFLLAAITSLGNLVGSLFALSLFYNNGMDLGGWRWEEAIVVMGLAVFMEGFTSTFLRPNVGRIVQHVREGTLDFVLLKPIDTQFWLSLRNLSLWGVPNLLYGVLVVIYGGRCLGLALSDFARGVIPLLIGLVVLYCIWFMLSTMSIWFVKVHNLTGLLRGLLEAGRYPTPAYPAAYQIVFTFVIPVTFLTTVPAAAIVGRNSASIWAALTLAGVLCLLSRAFWRLAMRFYSSASS